jgi:hypothetical protein
MLTGAALDSLPNAADCDVTTSYDNAKCEITTANYQAIVDARSICTEEYTHLQLKPIKSTDEKRSIEKRYLAIHYNVNDDIIDLSFMQTYARSNIQYRYKNLKSIYQSNTIAASLECIRERNRRKDVETGVPHNTYARHKIAIDLIQECGWENLSDTNMVPREVLNTRLLGMQDKLKNQMYSYILPAFPGKRPLEKWEDLPAVLKFINGILDVMYGVSIGCSGDSKKKRQLFKLHHWYYGKIFSNLPNETMPYIEPN